MIPTSMVVPWRSVLVFLSCVCLLSQKPATAYAGESVPSHELRIFDCGQSSVVLLMDCEEVIK